MKNFQASRWAQQHNRNQVTIEKSQSKVMILRMLTLMKNLKRISKKTCLKITTFLIQMTTIMAEVAATELLKALEELQSANHLVLTLVLIPSL